MPSSRRCAPNTQVLFNDFQRQWADTREDVLAAVEAVGESGWYVLGKEVEALEQDLAGFWQTYHAVGVASGLDALEICLRVLGCGPGDRVLTTPLSAFATTLAIVRTGARPVFADVDEYGLLDLAACERTLEERSDIRFLLPVHLYGHSLDARRLRHLRERFGVKVIEDCAQSVGASYRGHPTGTAGDLCATSFYPTKNLGALGDGGAILTSSPEHAHAARVLRDYGQAAKYRHTEIGYNSRLDELQAAILRRAHLPRLPGWTARRGQIAKRYHDGIRNASIRVGGAPDGSDSCWHLFPVFVDADSKAAFQTHLRERGISAAEHYPVAIPDQPALASVPHESVDELSRARLLCRSEVSLPIHPYLTDAEVDCVLEACNEWRP